MNPYRQRVLSIFSEALAPLRPVSRALDFGSGDGWFAQQLEETGLVRAVTPIEVQERPNALRQPQIYDGVRLPFANQSFDLVYSVDVLHHCREPRESLRDALRVAKRSFLLKDHTWRWYTSYLFLCFLDEIGNRRFGIPCFYNHQRRWNWFETIRSEGFELEKLVHPAQCHTGAMKFVNRFEFVSLWRRVSSV
jgi:SAM-dependent methyltransferase